MVNEQLAFDYTFFPNIAFITLTEGMIPCLFYEFSATRENHSSSSFLSHPDELGGPTFLQRLHQSVVSRI